MMMKDCSFDIDFLFFLHLLAIAVWQEREFKSVDLVGVEEVFVEIRRLMLFIARAA